ncbi:MAG: hypothetical protein GX561_04475 [Lentisphaerae bacterium]|jgi:hypothetical protein|nr:hypothetical protein [Lentisphaerota bacterium]
MSAMRRPIAWVEKDEDGMKTQIRVSFRGENIKWQFLDPGETRWDYDRTPTEEQWEELDEKLANMLQRGYCCMAEIELAKRRGKPRK